MMNRVEMNDRMMDQVNGGLIDESGGSGACRWIHNNCGGEIEQHVFGYNKCKKCGETNFWMWDFDYHEE